MYDYNKNWSNAVLTAVLILFIILLCYSFLWKKESITITKTINPDFANNII